MSGLSMSERAPESATADLQVCLLGPPSLAWRGEPLTLPRRQARALLFYLAAVPQPVTRDHLCLLFWPDATRNYSPLQPEPPGFDPPQRATRSSSADHFG